MKNLAGFEPQKLFSVSGPLIGPHPRSGTSRLRTILSIMPQGIFKLSATMNLPQSLKGVFDGGSSRELTECQNKL